MCALSLDHITPKTLALYGLLTFASLRASLYSLTSAFRDLTDLLKNECFIYAKLSMLCPWHSALRAWHSQFNSDILTYLAWLSILVVSPRRSR